jgi:type III restriction enzyme
MKKTETDAFSQLYLAEAMQGEVAAWVDQGCNGVTKTTSELLNYWFNRDEDTPERFHPCQRRAIETVIYCCEILKPKTLKDLFEKAAPEALYQHLPLKNEVETIRFPKYALKMATGSGKTWVLAALLVWQYFNKINSEQGDYSYRFVVVTPGHEVLYRMLDSFKGKRDTKTGTRDPQTSDYKKELLIPPGVNWRDRFSIISNIFEPNDIQSNTSSPDGPFVYITNWQQFRFKKTDSSLWAQYTGEDVEEAPRGETILDFLSEYPDLIVMNDEAHHVHAEKKPKKETGRDEELVWRQFMDRLFDRLKENHTDNFGPFMQIDFSATPFYGSGEKREFFPHIVYDYPLINAMHDMLVKQLFLEERQSIAGESLEDLDFRAERLEPEGSHKRGEIAGLSRDQKLLLAIGKAKLEQLSTEFKSKSLDKKPVMLVLCEDTTVADFVKEHFATLTDENALFYDDSKVLVIHSSLKDSQLKEASRNLDKIDINDDPLRLVISVLMLREGFDKNNICVTVVLRATEADLLLEQIVGRGLRLMFPSHSYPELQDSKKQAYDEIRLNKQPSNSLDFLFVVEHPRFRAFYESLKQQGYIIGSGDTSQSTSTGDIIPVDAIPERMSRLDLAWPIQIYDEGRLPDLAQIDISNLPKYPSDFDQLKRFLQNLTIQETHLETGKKTKTWKLENEYFDYNFFLMQAAKAVATKGKSSILTAKRAAIAAIIDDYVSTYCFRKQVDFTKSENYSVLNYSDVFDHIIDSVRNEIIRLIEGYKYEPKGIWASLSEVPRIMVRESKSVETDKSIYPRLPYQPKGGGFERDFMINVLNPSSEVIAYAKIDRRHKLKIQYRDETSILRTYEIDFLIKTSEKMYLLETKADKDINSPNISVKARAATAWSEQASTVAPPLQYNQPQLWEYLVLSESIFQKNQGLGFNALIPFCRVTRDRIIAQSKSRLFI